MIITKVDVDKAVSFSYNRHTRASYTSAIRSLVGREWDEETVAWYINESKRYSQATITVRRAALVKLQSVMGTALLDSSERFPIGNPPVPREGLPDKTVDSIIAAARTDIEKLVIYILADTGLRLGSLVQLTFDDLSKESAMLRVKRGKVVEVFFSPRVRILAALLGEGPDRIFGNGDYHAVYKKLYRIVKRVATRAGQGETVPHQFRHHFITKVAEASGISVARLLAGHRNVETTMRYIHPDRAAIRGGAMAAWGEQNV